MSEKEKNKSHLFIVTPAAKVRLTILFIILSGFAIWSWYAFRLPSSPEQIANQAQFLETVYSMGNYIEACIWELIGIIFIVKSIKSTRKNSHLFLIAAINFSLFGISDIVEVQTGAWWHPWWLFLWKISCVFVMFCLLIIYLKKR